MSNIWTSEFWKATAERALRTAAQAAILVLIGDAYESVQLDALAVDWLRVLGFALGGAILAVLFSIAGNVASKTGPSFGDTEVVQPASKLPDVEGRANGL
jgi:hypothetical protein